MCTYACMYIHEEYKVMYVHAWVKAGENCWSLSAWREGSRSWALCVCVMGDGFGVFVWVVGDNEVGGCIDI